MIFSLGDTDKESIVDMRKYCPDIPFMRELFAQLLGVLW